MVIAFIALTHNLDKDKTTKFDGIRDGLFKANMKLDSVCATTSETRTDIKALNRDLVEIEKRVVILEQDMKTAFCEIKEIKERE